MKLSDQQRKAMFARLEQHVKDQNYDGLKRWHQTNENQYGKDVAEGKLFRTFTKYDKKIKEFGSLKAWSEDKQKKRGEAYDKAGVKRRKESQERWEKQILAKYGSFENYKNQYNVKIRAKVAEIKRVKENPKVAQEVSREYALTGSKYYKQNMANMDNPKAPYLDSIHCANCSQRLGNSITPCPLCGNKSLKHIYGYMLSHPSDPRWLLPKYNQNKFNHPSETTGLQGLSERMKDAGDVSDLK